MEIYTVQPGDSVFQISQKYHLPMDRLIIDNQLPDPSRLVVGQTLVIRFPACTHTVSEGDTLPSIAEAYQTSVKHLLQNNPNLSGAASLVPGQILVIRYSDQPSRSLTVNGYAYPGISIELLHTVLPYLSQITPFTYRFTPEGALVPPPDSLLISIARQAGTVPVFHLSNLDPYERFSPELAHLLLTDPVLQQKLIDRIVEAVEMTGYGGVDIDFEYIYGQDAADYAGFLARLKQALSSRHVPLLAALAPKTSDNQAGRLYEGHDYDRISQAVDFVLLMTYDWGWSGGPPMAVSPLPQVRQVLEYAVTKFSPERIYMGIPNYGYDWTLPYHEGRSAVSIDNVKAVQLAWDRHASIRYDEIAQSPWFRYTDEHGQEHQVWFEDARSIQAKLNLALEKNLHGISYWNLDRPFPQNWAVLNAIARIQGGPCVQPNCFLTWTN